MAFKKLSVFTERMLPDFVKHDHPQFVKFLKYYFEFLEKNDGVYDYTSHALEYMDIDETKDSMLSDWQDTFLVNFPDDTEVDVRFLVKHIREFYKSKGSEESYRFLFRLLYGDDDIDLYYPKLNILRCSDGKWDDANQVWTNTDGLLSEDMKLQDNYYYQDFSYEIISDVTRYYYENIIKENVHIAGMLMFGRNLIINDGYLSVVDMDYDYYDRLKNTDIGLVALWGGTPYTVSATQFNNHTILIDVNGVQQEESVEYPFLTISGSYAVDDWVGIRRLDHALGVDETFIGDDTTATFTLDNSYTATQLLVFVAGLKQYEGIDFTISGTDITLAVAPAIGEKVRVHKHTIRDKELISGTGVTKYITLTNDPQGFLLNKVMVYVNNKIVLPESYDPVIKRLTFSDYISEGTNNVEVLHIESLGYIDRIQIVDAVTKYNINTNKNEFRNFPKSAFITVIVIGDDIKPKLSESVNLLMVYVTPSDDVTTDVIENVTLNSFLSRADDLLVQTSGISYVKAIFDAQDDLEVKANETSTSIFGTAQLTDDNLVELTDGNVSIFGLTTTTDDNKTKTDETSIAVKQTSERTDISFTATSTISTVAGDFTLFSDGDTIVITTSSTTNDGTYTISGAPTTTTITISETTLTTEDAATAGTVTVSRTI